MIQVHTEFSGTVQLFFRAEIMRFVCEVFTKIVVSI